MTFNPPTYLLHTMQYVGGMRSIPPTHTTVWCMGLLPPCAALSLCQEQGSARPPSWPSGVPGGLAQGRQVSGRLPLPPCFLTQGVFAVHQEHIFLTGTT